MHYTHTYTQGKTYLFGILFAAGNLLLPQLCHLVPWGGPTLLPIYFFTLIAAYKYGWQVGLLTALLSPLASHFFFGMPPARILPILLIKSTLLALAAAYAAYHFKKISFVGILLAIVAYQILGTLVEWALLKDFYLATQDFRRGLPGMLLQLIGGYAVLKAIQNK